MTKILVIQGKGLDLRGKTQIEVFGPMTLADYNRHVEAYAKELGVAVEIFQSNVEADVIARFIQARGTGVDAAILNPGGFTRDHPELAAVIAAAPFPTIEVHISNPAARGTQSDIARVCKSTIAGFGVAGYRLGMLGIKELLAKA
jgi:3-dehydroquinate dehydratase-2